MIRKHQRTQHQRTLSTSVMSAVLMTSLIVQMRTGIGKPDDIMSSIDSPDVGAPLKEKQDIADADLRITAQKMEF